MTDNMYFNKSDYQILEMLIYNECFSPVESLSIRQLSDLTKLSLSKIRLTIKGFLIANLIGEGTKDGNNKTYYMTELGIEHFKRVYKLTEDDLRDDIEDYKLELNDK